MAMILCSSRLAAVKCYLRLCQIQRRDSRLTVPVILGVSAGFRQFPPSVRPSAAPLILLVFQGLRPFRPFRRSFFGARRDGGKVLVVGLVQRQMGRIGVCRPAKGLALEAERHDVGLRSDTQLVK